MSFAVPHTEPIQITLPGTEAVVRTGRRLRLVRLVCLGAGHSRSRSTYSASGARCMRCGSKLRQH